MKKTWLYQKTVIVTGASSGIGRELCIRLVKNHGCKVIGVARCEEKCLALRTELGDNFLYQLFDVSQKSAWQGFSAWLKEHGHTPDVLINNAGMLPPFTRFDALNIDDFERVMNVNFYSIVYGCNELLPLLKQSSTPAILNIASSAALCALPGITGYASSKAAVKSFTESLTAEYDKKDFYVGLILPGFTLTDIFRLHQKDENADKLIASIAMPQGKMADKIERALIRKKRRKIFGVDAVGMNILYKLFPASAATFCGNILRMAKTTLFDGVFPKDNVADDTNVADEATQTDEIDE